MFSLQIACEHYQSKNMILEYNQKVEFEGSQISLDIPYPEGITKENGAWRIIPTSPCVVRNYVLLIACVHCNVSAAVFYLL